jgi:hypothetical protein
MLDGRLPTVLLRMNRASVPLFEDAEQIRIRLAQCDYPGAILSIDLRGGRPRHSSSCEI